MRSFRAVLEHLATLTRNNIRVTDGAEFDLLATPPTLSAARSSSSINPSR